MTQPVEHTPTSLLSVDDLPCINPITNEILPLQTQDRESVALWVSDAKPDMSRSPKYKTANSSLPIVLLLCLAKCFAKVVGR